LSVPLLFIFFYYINPGDFSSVCCKTNFWDCC